MPAAMRRTPLILLLAVITAALSGCATPGQPPADPAEMIHIHGIAVNPSNPEEVYVATHHGLFKGVRDASWAPVGPARHDFMGFTVHPTDGNVVWTSGHPENPAPGRFNLGVLRSSDGGVTWAAIGLEHQVDFHAMTASRADPSILYGFFAPGAVWRSLDGGHTWNHTASAPAERVYAFTTHATDAGVVYAATPQGLHRSADRGDTWTRVAPDALAGQVGTVVASATRAQPDVLYASLAGGRLARSDDGGATWRDVASPVAGSREGVGHLAVDPRTPETLYAVVGPAIHKSIDGGSSWTRIVGA